MLTTSSNGQTLKVFFFLRRINTRGVNIRDANVEQTSGWKVAWLSTSVCHCRSTAVSEVCFSHAHEIVMKFMTDCTANQRFMSFHFFMVAVTTNRWLPLRTFTEMYCADLHHCRWLIQHFGLFRVKSGLLTFQKISKYLATETFI